MRWDNLHECIDGKWGKDNDPFTLILLSKPAHLCFSGQFHQRAAFSPISFHCNFRKAARKILIKLTQGVNFKTCVSACFGTCKFSVAQLLFHQFLWITLCPTIQFDRDYSNLLCFTRICALHQGWAYFLSAGRFKKCLGPLSHNFQQTGAENYIFTRIISSLSLKEVSAAGQKASEARFGPRAVLWPTLLLLYDMRQKVA